MSRKQSAYQVYSENQGKPRHSGSARSPHSSGTSRGSDVWRVENSRVEHQPRRRSPSPDLRREQGYVEYSDKSDTAAHNRNQSTSIHKASRYQDDQYNRRSWSSDTGRNFGMDVGTKGAGGNSRVSEVADGNIRLAKRESLDHSTLRDRADTSSRYKNSVDNNRLKDSRHSYSTDSDSSYVQPKSAEPPKVTRSLARFSDSDDECLHESLRRKKSPFLDNDQREYSTDDDAYDIRSRKRTLREEDYDSLDPIPAKVWKEKQYYSSDEGHHNMTQYGDSCVVAPVAPVLPAKKKKRGKMKGKGKKQKLSDTVEKPLLMPKIQSLMDIQIPSSVKKQVERCTANSAELGRGMARFGENKSNFLYEGKGGQRYAGDDHSTSRAKLDDNGYQPRSAGDGRRQTSEFDRRGYRRSEDDVARDIDRGRGSREFTGADSSLSKRKRHGSGDWQRASNRPSQKDRTPTRSATDSDQDSDHEDGRRSWRDERRDRQIKKNSEAKLGDQSSKKDKREKGKKRASLGKSQKSSDVKSKGDLSKKNKGDKQDPKTKSKVSSKTRESTSGRPVVKGDEKAKDNQSSEGPKIAAASTAKREDSNGLQVIPCKEGLAVLLTHPVQVCLRGRCRVKILAGEVDIMGYTLRAVHEGSAKEYDLFSPTTSSHLSITTVSGDKTQQLRKCLKSLDIEDKAHKDLLSRDVGVLILATKLSSPVIDFLSTLAPFTQIFRYNFERPPHPLPSLLGTSVNSAPSAAASQPEPDGVAAAFIPCDSGAPSFLRTAKEFETALSRWTDAVKDTKAPPVAVLCGGVNCGKSSFSRFMINVALSVVPRVGYFDCDAGQTEFTPPGTVALTVVDEPLFGPPFCHQRRAESMCFYGHTSPADNPDHYIECLQHVFQVYRQMESPVPLIVNTMGWNQDAGLRLFIDILHLVTPDLVIQINVANQTLNFPEITPEFPLLEAGWTYNTDPMGEEFYSSRKKHELLTVDSLVPVRTDLLKMTPKNLRDLTLLSHLTQGLSQGVTLVSSRARAFPWTQMAFYVSCEGANDSSLEDNGPVENVCGSVVALCHSDISQAVRVSEDLPLTFLRPPACECFGYGFVRGFGQKNVLVYIVTPLSNSQLNRVNTLLKGSITLPDQLILKQSSLEGVSYVGALEPTLVTPAHRPRSRMPRRN